MRERIDSILDFAELEDYRFVPVKGLSSGMVARLGFAIATDIQPDILILDEVLSVGDESFKNKCQKRINKFWDSHVTILVVSYSMEFIRQSCDKAIWLRKESVNLAGESKKVIESYLDSVTPSIYSDVVLLENDKAVKNGDASNVILLEKDKIVNNGNDSEVIIDDYKTSDKSSHASITYSDGDRFVGDEYVRMICGCIKNSIDEISSEILINEDAKVVMKYEILMESNHKFIPNFYFHTIDGSYAFVTLIEKGMVLPIGEYEVGCILPMNFLNEGAYFVGLAISSFESNVNVHFYEQNILCFNIIDPLTNSVGRQHGYTGKVPRVVRPQLEWKLVQTK